jgi:NCS1 family nucleobase:cation symporter-1
MEIDKSIIIIGIFILFIGFIFSASTIWNVDLRFLQSFSWFLGALMSSITYYLLASGRSTY